VITSIRKCLDQGYDNVEVTALLVSDPAGTPVDFKTSKTLAILERTVGILMEYFNMYDVENAAMAFPDTKIRVISPSVPLIGGSLAFNTTADAEMVKVGYKDGLNAAGYMTLNEYVKIMKENKRMVASSEATTRGARNGFSAIA
jgi:hypothetical protein